MGGAYKGRLGRRPVQNVLPAQVNEWVAAGRAILLDVREEDEREQARIPGSLWIPMEDVTGRLAELPRDRTLIVYCHSGVRSAYVARHLMDAGLEAANLAGGIVAWHRSGLPIEH
jgi:rhodanese-related sulfurtransferase